LSTRKTDTRKTDRTVALVYYATAGGTRVAGRTCPPGERGRQTQRGPPSQLPSLPVRQRPQDGVENIIEMYAHIFGQKPQHVIAVLLQQQILAPVAAVGIGIGQMLRTVQFDRHTRVCCGSPNSAKSDLANRRSCPRS